jgi:uncharacterized protein YfaS (alpha-2-macroglobulin family)
MRTQGMPVAKEISSALGGQSWLSTQETAFSLLAMSKFASTGAKNSKLDYNYTINDEKPVHAVTEAKIGQTDMKIKQYGGGKVSIKNNSTGVLYARVIQTGIPNPGDEVAAENNLKLKVVYKDGDGDEIDPSEIVQGTDFYAEVTISNPGIRGIYKNMALQQIFPSGWEIHNTRLDNATVAPAPRSTNNEEEETEGDGGTTVVVVDSPTSNGLSRLTDRFDIPTYQDIRDDRVNTFFDLPANSSKTFRIALNAAYLGKFYLPSLYSEAMYDGSINATIPGKWVEVVNAEGKGVALKE